MVYAIGKDMEYGAKNSSESGHPYAFRDDDGRAYLFCQGSPDGGKTWYLSHTRIGFQGGKPMLMKVSIEPGIHQEVVLNWCTKPS